MSFINQIPKQKKRKSYSAPSYLLLKPTGLFFRIAVPSDLRDILGKREYQLALKTCSLKEGRPKVLRLAILAHDAFNRIRELKRNNHMTKELDDKTIRKLADDYVKKNLRSYFEVNLSRVPFSLEQKEEQDALHNKLSQSALDEANTMNIKDMEKKADAILEHGGFSVQEVDKNSIQYKKLCLALKKAKATIYEELAKPDFLSSFSLFEEEEEKQVLSCVPPIVAPAVPVAEAKTSPRLEEVLSKYIELKRIDSEDIQSWVREFLETLTYYHPTLCVHEITEDMIKRYYDDMYNLPRKQKRDRIKDNPYKGKSRDQLHKMDIPQADKLAIGTIKRRFQRISGVLDWISKRYPLENAEVLKEVLVFSKEDNKKLAKSVKKRAYTIDELKTLFLSPTYKGEARGFKYAYDFWLPLLALFTGARLKELAQLFLEDISVENGMYILDLNEDETAPHLGKKKLKNLNSIRKVPLHPFLIELGFMDRVNYLRKIKVPHLFQRPAFGKNWEDDLQDLPSKRFTNFRRKCNVGTQKDGERVVDFHSFRNTFTSRCKVLKIHRPQYQAVIGHSANDMTERYEDDYPLDMLFHDVIMKIDFHECLGLEVLKDHAKKWEKVLG